MMLALAGCATVPTQPPIAYTGDALVDTQARLAVSPAKDRALWNYRLGVTALRRAESAVAKTSLDEGLALAATAASGQNAEAAKSRRLFRAEADKPFVGEPYERVMANFYRGLLYWQDGEPDNARALFRTGQLLDSYAADTTYAGDYVLLDWLDGLASAKLGGDGTDALARARKNAKRSIPDLDPKSNVLVVVEYGRGPRKYAGGENGEYLRFFTEPSKVTSAQLRIGEQTYDLSPYDDLNYQATTRGGRVMDAVLGNKAVFKQGASTVGDVALVGALGTAAYGRGEDAPEAALALAAVGLISKLASAATVSEADTRTWDNLPQYLSAAALRLPPGEYAATLEFKDASGSILTARTQTFVLIVPAPDPSIGARAVAPDVVVFRSDLRN